MHFLYIEQLKEQLKSYFIAKTYDERFARDLLTEINARRLQIAIDAEMREIFYAQQDIPAVATGYQQSVWFSKNDIRYNLRRAIANLVETVTISATNQGNAQRIITREPIAWQQIFSAIESNIFGQQIPFDFEQEMRFAENESLGLAIQGQTSDGQIFYHGCTLKDALVEATANDLKSEIGEYLPQPQIVPLIFQFPSAVVGSDATDASGGNQIFSAKNSRSVLLTHVSTTAPDCRLTIIDEGRNQMLCDTIEMRGVAGLYTNEYTTYYPLPYPHLLRRGDRLKIRVLQGSLISGNEMTINTLNYLTFKGYTI